MTGKRVFKLAMLGVLHFPLGVFSQMTQQWAAPLISSNDTSSSSVAMVLDKNGLVYTSGLVWNDTVGSFDFIAGSINTNNGNIMWSKVYGSLTGDDYNYSLSVDDSCNVYASGLLHFGSSKDPITVKYKPNGVQQWVKGNGYQGGKSIVKDNALFAAEGDSVKQYDLNGNRLWSTSVLSTTSIASDIFLAGDNAGNLYIGGRHPISGSEQSIVVKKFNPTGVDVWEKSFHPSSGLDVPYSMTIDDSANVYILGTQDWQGLPAYTLVKYDSSGNQRWAKSYTVTLGATGHDVIVDKKHNVYVSGKATTTAGSNYSVVKYDLNGNFKWISIHDSAMISSLPNSFLALDSLDNVLITYCQKISGATSNIITSQLDSAGNIKWRVKYDQTASGVETPSEILVDKNGNVYVSGTSNNQMLVIKYGLINSINDQIGSLVRLNIHPNPWASTTTISFPEELVFSDRVDLIIYNGLGNVVYHADDINNSSISITKEDWKAGIYLCKLASKRGVVGIGKFIVQNQTF